MMFLKFFSQTTTETQGDSIYIVVKEKCNKSLHSRSWNKQMFSIFALSIDYFITFHISARAFPVDQRVGDLQGQGILSNNYWPTYTQMPMMYWSN